MNYEHEVVITREGMPCKIDRFEGRDGNYIRKPHWHNSIEIFAVYSGYLDFVIGDRRERVMENDFIFINTNEIHSIKAEKANYALYLQIPINEFKNYLTADRFIDFNKSEGDGISKLSEADQKAVHNEVLAYMKKLYELSHDTEIGYDYKMLQCCYELMYIIVRNYRKTESDEALFKSVKAMLRLSPVTDYIKKHYAEDISLSTLSAEFGYSTEHLSRMFQKYAGVKYKSYISEIRLDHAEKLLEKGDMSISEVASAVGFADSRAMAKVFEKRYGILPSEYLKNQKKAK